jgi:Ricin-type beta-trefoil lectin domain
VAGPCSYLGCISPLLRSSCEVLEDPRPLPIPARPCHSLSPLPRSGSGPSHDCAREVPSKKPQEVGFFARLGAALPWSELVLAIAQLALISGSVLLAAHLFRMPDGEMCLDLLGGNTRDGAEIGVWDCLQNDNQKWSVTSSGEIRWAGGASRCLAVQDAQDAAPLLLQQCDGSASQKFSFSANKIHHGGKCVDLRPAEDRTRRGTAELPGNGWRALLFPCEAVQTNQEWHFSGPIRQAGKCVDSRPQLIANGSPVGAWDCVDDNQVWDVHF